MSRKILIVGPGGSRAPAAETFPLEIGSGATADIRISGALADQSLALLSLLDDRPFLQLIGNAAIDDASIAINGEPVTGTRWLDHGDVIAARGTTITCDFDDDVMRFKVDGERIEYTTRPPELDETPALADDPVTIQPTPRSVQSQARTQPSRSRRTWWLFYGALTLLLGLALYLFSTRAVLIEVDPPDAQVRVAGGLLPIEFGERFLLRPGSYRVLLAADGFEPLREEIQVSDEDNQTFRLEMKKLPGRLVVATSIDADATVSIDETDYGALPTNELLLEPGVHSIRITANRYRDFEADVEIEGRDILQNFIAELEPAWADITVTSMPAGAAVYANEAVLGETPATIQLPEGEQELFVKKEGYKIWRKQLAVVANEPQVLTEIQLQEADGLLTVASRPAGAAVSVDGRYLGMTPVETQLPPGKKYAVVISKAGFASLTQTVSMESRRGKVVNVDLEPRIGTLVFVVEQDGAELFIDGTSRGKANQELSLPAKAHRIEIRKAGFVPYVAEITPKPGLPKRLNVKLLTPQQSVLAASPRTVTTSQGQTLLLVDPGEFTMGAPRRQQGRRSNETEHKVRLTRQFYIGTHEVTNEQFRAFKPNHSSGSEKYRELGNNEHPAVALSWEEATGYCNWLSHQEGLPFAYVTVDGETVLATPVNSGYRLPTEAEWAWAARFNGGGGARKYPWGERMPPPPKIANFADRSARGILTSVLSGYEDGYPITAPVGQFPASPIGLFDIGGNVAEWVNDRFGVYANVSEAETDPVGPTEGQYHVIRGSGWRHANISELRFAYRDFGDRGGLDIGFRIARYADQPVE